MATRPETIASAVESSDREAPSALTSSLKNEEEQVFKIKESRKLGVVSSVFLILNKMIGTGSQSIPCRPLVLGSWSDEVTYSAVFSTPSGIFASTGSVGVCLMLWFIGQLPHLSRRRHPPGPPWNDRLLTRTGGIITFTGLSVYLEFGLQIPRSGGEKNYLERVYRHPKYLATSVFLSQMILLGFSTGNSLAFGRYILLASGSSEADGWIARGIAIACITFAVVLHGTFPRAGMRLFDVLGVFKVMVLLFIVCSGFAALAGHRKIPDPRNFDNAVSL